MVISYSVKVREGLTIAWKPTADKDPREAEKDLINHFIDHYGKLPFANLVD